MTKKAWAPAFAGVIGMWGLSLPAHAADPAPVVAAERAFAADGAKHGVNASFLRWSAPEAIVFIRTSAVRAQSFYAERPPGRGERLSWWPTFAGLAASGDLGFTTGPFEADGRRAGSYFTVWRRQPDGAWRWIFDGGVTNDVSAAPDAKAEPAAMPAATGEAGADAKRSVAMADEALNARAAAGVIDAYAAVLAPDARIQGSSAAPAASPAAVSAELARRPARFAAKALGAEVSQAGDLAWTYGGATWPRDDYVQEAHYVRIWRADGSGWRLVFDQLMPVPPEPTE